MFDKEKIEELLSWFVRYYIILSLVFIREFYERWSSNDYTKARLDSGAPPKVGFAREK